MPHNWEGWRLTDPTDRSAGARPEKGPAARTADSQAGGATAASRWTGAAAARRPQPSPARRPRAHPADPSRADLPPPLPVRAGPEQPPPGLARQSAGLTSPPRRRATGRERAGGLAALQAGRSRLRCPGFGRPAPLRPVAAAVGVRGAGALRPFRSGWLLLRCRCRRRGARPDGSAGRPISAQRAKKARPIALKGWVAAWQRGRGLEAGLSPRVRVWGRYGERWTVGSGVLWVVSRVGRVATAAWFCPPAEPALRARGAARVGGTRSQEVAERVGRRDREHGRARPARAERLRAAGSQGESGIEATGARRGEADWRGTGARGFGEEPGARARPRHPRTRRGALVSCTPLRGTLRGPH